MTAKELAALLNGRKYLEEITAAEERQAKESGLLVVFGASDDLIELRGAINDEQGAWQGCEILVDKDGIVPSFNETDHDDYDDMKAFFQREGSGKAIEAVWVSDGYSWTYKTEIPHETFDIMEDGEKYCRGIVFAIADLA